MGDFDLSNPDFSNNLLRFGLATMQAGGTPGATLGGAIGAGALNAIDYAQLAPYRRAQLAQMGAQTTGLNLENALKALTVQGYQDLQNLYGGGPATAGGSISSALPQTDNAADNQPSGQTAGMPHSPTAGATVRPPQPVGQADGDSYVSYPNAGAGSSPLTPQRIGQLPPQVHDTIAASGAPIMPRGSAGTNPLPLFDTGQLANQYRALIRIPGMQQVASQVLSMIPKAPEGAYIGIDGGIYARPGFNQFRMGASLADKGYQQNADGSWSINPAVPRGEAAVAGAKAAATFPYDVTRALAERAGMPIRLGPNETVESGFDVLPSAIQARILGAAGAGGVPSYAARGPAPSPAPAPVPRTSIGGFNVGSAPSPVTGLPLNAGTSPPRTSAAAQATTATPGPRTTQSFALPNLFNGSSDLPAPPHVQPFPTQPIRNADGSITSPYSTSTIGLQEEANKAYGVAHDQFNAGQTIQQRLALIDQGIELLNKSGWSSTGTGAQQKLEGLKAINSFLTSIDAPPLSNPEKIGSFEELLKNTGLLGLDRARSMGSREAAQVVHLSIGLNPGINNTYQGAKAIEASMGAAAQRDVDYYRFATQYAQQNGTTFGADVAFNQARPPELYARKAIAATIPQKSIALLMNAPAAERKNAMSAFDGVYGRGMSAFVLNGTLDGMPYASIGGLSPAGALAPGSQQAPRFPATGGAPQPVQ